ncbi:hypothetical protein AMTRI_Chr11g97120 [Amborella trichopoda]
MLDQNLRQRMGRGCVNWLEFFLLLSVIGVAKGQGVTYDGRSLWINGERKILFSGSIHYPRSTPQMWPSVIDMAKQGGLDVIQTYVFWNIHEPMQGQYNFGGRYDLVSFLKLIQSKGLYASLRIGPFIESEWNYGGFPFWLHDIANISFRNNNEPFKFYMQNFTTKIVNLMKQNGLYASQGGPIILSQIENEYKNVEGAYHEQGPLYVNWAASMAVGLNTGVPWMMCKQDDAPDPVINACNGMNCGETFAGPNSPNKPSLWTENWTSQYQVYGGKPYFRSAEDIAFAVAQFIAKNGSFVNYYMYHGGTNFGRTSSAYVTTSYYDQAPLDEYGMIRQPKWGHLKELHAAIKNFSEPLLSGKITNFSLGQLQEARIFEGNSGECVAFLINSDRNKNANVNFRNLRYDLNRRSISILGDCVNVVFDTSRVNVVPNVRSYSTSQKVEKWEAYSDPVLSFSSNASIVSNNLLEHMTTTKDESDYLWYTTSYDHSFNMDAQPKLHVSSRGHVVHVFVNNVYVGSAHGSAQNHGLVFEKAISLKAGKNNISLLSATVGFPDGGAFMERRVAGINSVNIQENSNRKLDLSSREIDLSFYQWAYQVGMLGEKLEIYTPQGAQKVEWTNATSSTHQPLTWYKSYIDAPGGSDPVAIDLNSMGKGQAWINGESIGRFWPSFLTPTGESSQTMYHIPRSFLKPFGNLVILFEEMGGDPAHVSLVNVTVKSAQVA